MNIGNRGILKSFLALFQVRHYRALVNMFVLSKNSSGFLSRYLFDQGTYPFVVNVRTPVGSMPITAHGYDDVLTINEIFFRKDYALTGDEGKTSYILDIGANIGISALYFLTRNLQSKVCLYEPDPRNLKKLYANIEPFKDRVVVKEKAVADFSGNTEFSIESTGRYGGIGRNFGSKITVECAHINEVLTERLSDWTHIDIVKLDVEGMESSILNAIGENLYDKIKTIFFETESSEDDKKLNNKIRDTFELSKYGAVRILVNRKLA